MPVGEGKRESGAFIEFGPATFERDLAVGAPGQFLRIRWATKPCLASDVFPLQPSQPRPSSYARSCRDG